MDKIIKYGMIIVRDGKFLVNRKHNTKLFLMPGGKPKPGENIEDCLIREIREEHNVELIPESIKFFGEFEGIAANESNTIVSMKLHVGDINGHPEISREIEEQKWFGRDDDPEVLSQIIREKILPAILKNRII